MKKKPTATERLEASPVAFRLSENQKIRVGNCFWQVSEPPHYTHTHSCQRQAVWGIRGSGKTGKAEAFCAVHGAKVAKRMAIKQEAAS